MYMNLSFQLMNKINLTFDNLAVTMQLKTNYCIFFPTDYDQNEHSNISRPIKLSEKLSAKDDYKEDRNFDNRYEDKHADDKHVDLVDWR